MKENPSRPFIVVGHCFGGLVIQRVSTQNRCRRTNEQAFLDDLYNKQSGTFDSCLGVILLGTPNRGTTTFDTQGSLLNAIAESSLISGDQESLKIEPLVLQDLKNLGGSLTETSEIFAQLCRRRNLDVICFFETQSSPVAKLVEGSNIASVNMTVKNEADLPGVYGQPGVGQIGWPRLFSAIYRSLPT